MAEPLCDAEIVSVGLATIAEVARFLRVGKSTVYLLLGRGELPAVKIGRATRIPKRAVVEFAARHLHSNGETGDA